MRIGGIFKANVLIGSYLVGDAFFLSHYQDPLPGGVLLDTDGNATAVEQRVQTALAPYPNVQVQSRAQFEKSQTASVNQLLGLVYALLGLAVIIALIGIVNTLMLSVFERTREIGLLRAVGMKRRQVRAMIRSESVILAIFGAVIGIVIGTGLGVALVSSLRSQGITDTVVPVSSLIIFLVLSAVLGLLRRRLAGPAGSQTRRAGRHCHRVAGARARLSVPTPSCFAEFCLEGYDLRVSCHPWRGPVTFGGVMRRGLDDGYDEFFVGVIGQAVGVANRVLGDHVVAEDAAVEALARAHLRWGRLRDDPHRQAWVLRVAINAALDAQRSSRRRAAPGPSVFRVGGVRLV